MTDQSAAAPFLFTQGSLQDFVDCRRRFQLRYQLSLAWPAIESEPILEQERRMRQGVHFHHLIQQYFTGIPPHLLNTLSHDAALVHWWFAFLDFMNTEPMKQLLENARNKSSEAALTASLAEIRLQAQCDLIVIEKSGKAAIFDWKTSQKRPKRSWLAARLQTRLYPYLLVRAGAYLNHGAPIEPGQVTFTYWFADFPEEQEAFTYSQEKYLADEKYIQNLITTIKSLSPAEFPMTGDLERCRYCIYRSLCDRGLVAGNFGDRVDDLEPSELRIDFDQTPGIEF